MIDREADRVAMVLLTVPVAVACVVEAVVLADADVEPLTVAA
jgi:hypothetical protein